MALLYLCSSFYYMATEFSSSLTLLSAKGLLFYAHYFTYTQYNCFNSGSLLISLPDKDIHNCTLLNDHRIPKNGLYIGPYLAGMFLN